MEAEALLDVSGLVEALRHQRLDALLRRGSAQRSDAGVPAGAELDVWRKAGVDQPLGLADRPFVEAGDPGRHPIDEGVELSIGEGAVDVPDGLGLVAAKIL